MKLFALNCCCCCCLFTHLAHNLERPWRQSSCCCLSVLLFFCFIFRFCCHTAFKWKVSLFAQSKLCHYSHCLCYCFKPTSGKLPPPSPPSSFTPDRLSVFDADKRLCWCIPLLCVLTHICQQLNTQIEWWQQNRCKNEWMNEMKGNRPATVLSLKCTPSYYLPFPTCPLQSISFIKKSSGHWTLLLSIRTGTADTLPPPKWRHSPGHFQLLLFLLGAAAFHYLPVHSSSASQRQKAAEEADEAVIKDNREQCNKQQRGQRFGGSAAADSSSKD